MSSDLPRKHEPSPSAAELRAQPRWPSAAHVEAVRWPSARVTNPNHERDELRNASSSRAHQLLEK
ncbi:MAG: hypothetical protein Q8P67_16585 [archaeon]|nr:hypothetical protein [archaeon]